MTGVFGLICLEKMLTFVNFYGNITTNRTIRTKVLFDKGKPFESLGRKAMSLRRFIRYDSQVANLPSWNINR